MLLLQAPSSHSLPPVVRCLDNSSISLGAYSCNSSSAPYGQILDAHMLCRPTRRYRRAAPRELQEKHAHGRTRGPRQGATKADKRPAMTCSMHVRCVFTSCCDCDRFLPGHEWTIWLQPTFVNPCLESLHHMPHFALQPLFIIS